MADAAADGAIISIRALRKSFGEHHVLRGVDLEVARGKVLTIIGRSGEGKSVLLKHILGLVEPDSGDVLVDGTSMIHSSPRVRRRMLRRFGMLFQNSALFDSMTVFDNVAFPLRENSEKKLSRKDLKRIVEEKLELVGLRGVSAKMPSELSGGMRKRVGLARAIALDPEILLYDEPTTGLDPVRVHAVDQLILQTARTLDVTSVVITHDMHSVFEIADEVAFLYGGRVHVLVSPEELRDHPSEVVQSFIHGRPMADASAGQIESGGDGLMRGGSEIKVGLFTATAIAAAVYFSMATTDNPFQDKGYELHASLISAEGLQPGSSVEMAGVRVGAINGIRIEAGRAIADIGMDPRYQLPLDSRVAVASRGILGDTVLKISSGTSDTMLQDGDWIESLAPPPSLVELQEQLGVVADDIQAITGSLRAVVDSEETRGSIAAILTNIEGFTDDLTSVTRDNRQDLDAVIDNMRLLTEQLTMLVEESRPEVAQELVSIREATDTLNRGLRRVESIAGKIDEGQGSLGMLVNDDRLATGLTTTIEDIGALVEQANRFQIEVYYRGEFHVTHRFPGARFGGKNVIGVRVKPRPDYWYVFEFVDDPLGDLAEETIFLDYGTGFQTVREVTRTDKLQFSFMFAKRWRDLVVRLGIKENSGAVGADLLLFDDRLGLSLDVYDFRWASWPLENGIPNVKLSVDVVPIKNIYLTVGSDNIVNHAIRGEFSWYVGGGVWFTDNDVKWILGSLPSGAL